MKDKNKAKKQLINELVEIRQKTNETEISKIYKAIFDNATDGILLADIENKKFYIGNKMICQTLGYSLEEIKNKGVMDIHPEEDLPYVIEQFEKQSKKEIGLAQDIPVKKKDGSIFYVDINSFLITSLGKTYLVGIFRDTTERKRAEEELRKAHDELGIRVKERTAELVTMTEQLKQEIDERKKTEEALKEVNIRFLTLINAIPDIIFFKDAQGCHLIANRAAEEFIGLSYKDIIGKSCEAFLPPDVAEQCQKSDNEVFEMQKPFRSEEQAIGKDGSVIFLETFKVPLYDASGNAIGLVGISRDITERKRSDQALKERENELETKTHNLEETNIALNVLLRKREEDKKELEEKILLNIKELVVPYLEKLKKNRLDEKQEAYVNILESNLNEIILPFSRRLSSKYMNFTPTEIEIANLLRQGKTSKEIAELINSSPKAVAFHRENIRRKLGLKNKKTNLKSYLLSLT